MIYPIPPESKSQHTMSPNQERNPKMIGYKWLPIIDASRCTGCSKCVAACGPACLAVVDQLAHLTNPLTCGSEEHCIPACPEDAIHMEWVLTEGVPSIGEWTSSKPA